MIIRITALGLIAFTLTLASVSRADFTFSTTSGGAIPFDSAGNMLVLTGQPVSPVLNFQNAINIQDVDIASTTIPPNLIGDVVPFSFTLNLVQTTGVQPSTPGTGSVNVTGSISITRSDIGGELSSLASLNIPTLTIGNTLYTFSGASYAAPTVNSLSNGVGSGNLSIEISPGIVVPEPCTLAILSLGAIGLIACRRFKLVHISST
jgi:hypothetical protein